MRLAEQQAGLREGESGEALLCRQDIIDEIFRLAKSQRKALAGLASIGYYRLAFGSIADAVSLLYRSEATAQELEQMDLFLVSEIKRPKDGTLEIKFFDRLKALEHLEQNSDEDTTAMSFFDAIGRSAGGGGADED